MTTVLDTRIREIILETVPQDGGTIGNQSLSRKLQETFEAAGLEYDEDAVKAVREQLVAEGVLGKGRGRGSAVYRKDSGGGSRKAPAKKSYGSARARAKEADAHQKKPGEDPSRQAAGKTEAPAADPSVYADGPYRSYAHADEATMRPDVGLQDQFSQVREPKSYRYDSSLAPELAWDENAEREFADTGKWEQNTVFALDAHPDIARFIKAKAPASRDRFRADSEKRQAATSTLEPPPTTSTIPY